MTIKELMSAINIDLVVDVFLLLDYCFSAENFENTFIEKIQAVPKLKKAIRENIQLFAKCTPSNEVAPHTIFIISIPSDDYENQWKKELSAFALCDEEVLQVIDKKFHIFDDDGEATISHYGFSNLQMEKIVNYSIAQSSLKEFGKEICAAKILSELFFWGIFPEQREKTVKDLDEELSKPIDKSQLIDSETFDDVMSKQEEQFWADLSNDERAYHFAKKHFQEETKEIAQRYRNRIISEIQNQLIKVIKEEYKNR